MYKDKLIDGLADLVNNLGPKATQLGLQLRDAGIKKVSEHNKAWLQMVRYHAEALSYRNGSVTIDDLRKWASELGENYRFPDHPNAWGAVFKEKGWVCIGHKRSEFASNHGREIKVWKWQGAQQ